MKLLTAIVIICLFTFSVGLFIDVFTLPVVDGVTSLYGKVRGY